MVEMKGTEMKDETRRWDASEVYELLRECPNFPTARAVREWMGEDWQGSFEEPTDTDLEVIAQWLNEREEALEPPPLLFHANPADPAYDHRQKLKGLGSADEKRGERR
jgi:hypothetical protein